MRTLLVVSLLVLTAPVAHAAPELLTLLVEDGSNFRSIGNERVLVQFDGAIVYERGRMVSKNGVNQGACDRFSWALDDAQLAALRGVAAKAGLADLKASYRKAGVHDGHQAAMLAAYPDRAVVSRFDNELPPAFRAVMTHLREVVLKDAETVGKKSRCDVATWLFLRPPSE